MKKKFLYSLFIAALGFTACEDKVELDVPTGEERLVIDGIFWNEPNSEITISKTAPYFEDGQTPRVGGAQVLITSDAGDTIALNENAADPGLYIAAEPGEIGKTYTLHITLNDGSSYTSLPERMNRVPEIDTIYYVDAADGTIPFEDEGFVVLIDTREPEGLGDFYRWIFFLNDTLQNEPEHLSYAPDDLVDGNLVTEIEIASELVLGDRVVAKQLSISERAFDFLSLVDQQTRQVGGPFDSPPSPIKGNVKNDNSNGLDALGYFMVSGVSTMSITVN